MTRIRRAIVFLSLASPLATAACGGPKVPATVTFNKDIAPIVYANCAPCHRPGQVAPFSLLSYADVAQHADDVANETFERHMPPWLPDKSEFAILGDRRLRDDQIDLIQRWVKGGKLEGAAADAQKPPVFPDGWQLGQPDAVLTLARPFTLQPSTEDVYRNLVIHTALPAGVFVRAVEFKTAGAPIHHAVIRVDRTSMSRRRDGQDGQPGFGGMAWGSIQDPDGHFIGWAPGRGPILSPDTMPWRLDRGADLVIEVHVIPTKVAVVIQPTVGLFFTPTPPTANPLTVRMGSKLIDIPAGAKDYVVTDTYQLPVSVDLLSVYPHAHYLGKDMLFTAELPGSAPKTLLHIADWSFHWQQDYRFATPIPLPAGTKLMMRYTFDNSAGNPENPSHPPVRVQTGPKSTDEMAEFALQVLPKTPSDAAVLAEAFDRRDRLANVAMLEKRVAETPNIAEFQALLGSSYFDIGREADAIPHLEAAIRLKGQDVSTFNYLGMALMNQRRMPEALSAFQRAAALGPRDEIVQFNLGNALQAVGRSADAEAAYRRSTALNPDYADAHVNLGALLMSRGRAKEAVTALEQAAALVPDSPLFHNNLASALAASGRFQDAMREVRRALQIDPNFGPAQDNLRKLIQLGIK